MSDRPITLIDGVQTFSLSLQDRGFKYADGVFETMLYERGKFPFLRFHLARLLSSCDRLNLSVDRHSLVAQLNQMEGLVNEAGFDVARVKLTVTRGEGGQGCYIGQDQAAVVCLEALRCDVGLTMTAKKNTSLLLAKHPLPSMPIIAGMKHMSRLSYIAAALGVERGPGQEILYLDEAGNLVETMHHNIYLVRCGELHTPRLHACGVEGVMKALIQNDIAPALGLEVVEKDIPWAALDQYDEVFISNAFAGLVSVDAIAHHKFEHSPIADQLYQAIIEYVLKP